MNRRRWLMAMGVLCAIAAVALIGRLAWMWYQPWHETYRIRSTSAEQICLDTHDLTSKYRTDKPRCFPASLLPPGAKPAVGGCVQVTLEHEGARITGATLVTCL